MQTHKTAQRGNTTLLVQGAFILNSIFMSNIDKNVIHVFNLPTTMVGEAAVLDTVGGNI